MWQISETLFVFTPLVHLAPCLYLLTCDMPPSIDFLGLQGPKVVDLICRKGIIYNQKLWLGYEQVYWHIRPKGFN